MTNIEDGAGFFFLLNTPHSGAGKRGDSIAIRKEYSIALHIADVFPDLMGASITMNFTGLAYWEYRCLWRLMFRMDDRAESIPDIFAKNSGSMVMSWYQ